MVDSILNIFFTLFLISTFVMLILGIVYRSMHKTEKNNNRKNHGKYELELITSFLDEDTSNSDANRYAKYSNRFFVLTFSSFILAFMIANIIKGWFNEKHKLYYSIVFIYFFGFLHRL